jgi:hypothetical protein
MSNLTTLSPVYIIVITFHVFGQWYAFATQALEFNLRARRSSYFPAPPEK